jgi:hypothetical protein
MSEADPTPSVPNSGTCIRWHQRSAAAVTFQPNTSETNCAIAAAKAAETLRRLGVPIA